MNILAIDPGSTSTKCAVYRNGDLIPGSYDHPRSEIDSFPDIYSQKSMRMETITRFLGDNYLTDLPMDAVVGRGGLLKPLQGGVYQVNGTMLKDLETGINGHHASNLGGILAHEMALQHNCPAFIVDPVVVDEMWPPARYTGLKGMERKSIFHALNQKAAARKACEKLGKTYNETTLIVAHLGGGISVGAHKNGKVVDVNNALDGDGPFAPERSGSLPVSGLLDLLEQETVTIPDLKKSVSRTGGVYSYLGTVDMKQVQDMASSGNREASDVLDSMVYQVAKEIGALAAALDGQADAIVLTGGMAQSKTITSAITAKVSFIAPVYLEPGEHELEALVNGAIRVLIGSEPAQTYGETV